MKYKIIFLILTSVFSHSALSDIKKDAELVFKIVLKKAPTSRPQTVAYIPAEKKYYIADGGLAPMGSAYEAPISKSLIHTYDEQGQYLDSTKSTATISGSAFASAIIPISVGPANKSIPTFPNKILLASATN